MRTAKKGRAHLEKEGSMKPKGEPWQVCFLYSSHSDTLLSPLFSWPLYMTTALFLEFIFKMLGELPGKSPPPPLSWSNRAPGFPL
jgi:hypothetical protein